MTIGGVDLSAAANKVSQSLTSNSTVANRMNAMAANATSGTTPGTGASAGTNQITSGDFLTLLVTEMKNQDPTQPTDPNAYVQQLVGVNSLQQLISINQELGPQPAPSSSTHAIGAPTSASIS